MPKLISFPSEICGLVYFEYSLLLVPEQGDFQQNNQENYRQNFKANYQQFELNKIRKKTHTKDNKKRLPGKFKITKRKTNDVTCFHCGHTQKVVRIHVFAIKKCFGLQISTKKLSIYKGCQVCLRDFTFCKKNQHIQQHIGKSFECINQLLNREYQKHVYTIKDVEETQKNDVKKDLKTTQEKKRNIFYAKNIENVTCGDVLYCKTCRTVFHEGLCVGCGQGRVI